MHLANHLTCVQISNSGICLQRMMESEIAMHLQALFDFFKKTPSVYDAIPELAHFGVNDGF